MKLRHPIYIYMCCGLVVRAPDNEHGTGRGSNPCRIPTSFGRTLICACHIQTFKNVESGYLVGFISSMHWAIRLPELKPTYLLYFKKKSSGAFNASTITNFYFIKHNQFHHSGPPAIWIFLFWTYVVCHSFRDKAYDTIQFYYASFSAKHRITNRTWHDIVSRYYIFLITTAKTFKTAYFES